MPAIIKQSTAVIHIPFFMTDSADHISGKTGLAPTVTLSKNTAAFGAAAGAITEISSGWYKLAANATDSNTLGMLALHATAAGADACDMLAGEVVAFDPQDAVGLGLTGLLGTLTGEAAGLGIADAGTALAATGTTLQMRAAAVFGDNACVGMLIAAKGSTQGYWQVRQVNSNVGATDTLTVDAWAVTPSGTITYILFLSAPFSSSAGFPVDAASVRAAIGMAAANMDTQLLSIKTDTGSITTRIPAALVGGRMDSNTGSVNSTVITGTGTITDVFRAVGQPGTGPV